MINDLQNSVLQQAEQKIEAGMTPKTKANYMKVVVAGMRAGLHGGPNSILASIRQSKNPLQDCALGAINLATLLFQESRGTMPMQALVPGAMTLMLKALDFADKVGVIKIGGPELAQATHIFTATIMQRLGVTTQMLQHATGKIHAMTNDPVQMERLKREAGVVKAPNASTPTPLPGA